MIERFTLAKNKNYWMLLEFIDNHFDYDFYYTQNNERIYINDEITLKALLRASNTIYVSHNDKEDINGIVLLWKSEGGGKQRYYVKLLADTEKIASNLLTVLSWNYKNDLFVKLRKDSKFLTAFKSKGYKFLGGRGIQILLHRKKVKEKSEIKSNEHNSQHNRNISKISIG